MTARPPRSVRWPAVRGGLLGVVGALLPLVWVVRLSSCGYHPLGERTGLDLMREPSADLIGMIAWPIVLVLCVTTPWWAGRVARAMHRAMLSIVGLGTTAAVALFATAPIFPILDVQRIRPAGYAVVALVAASLADAVARLCLSVLEWLAERRTAIDGRRDVPEAPRAPSDADRSDRA